MENSIQNIIVDMCPMCFGNDVSLFKIKRPEYIQTALRCNNCGFEFVNNYTSAMSEKSRKMGLKE